MSESEVVALMKSSRNEWEWDDNCDKVKVACGGYPEFWFAAVLMSGVARSVSEGWSRAGKGTR